MTVELIHGPSEADWLEVKRRALVTVGKKPLDKPRTDWRRAILRARHSPIRYLVYSYYIHDIPTWVSTHLVRHHVGIQPYVRSQRNDRQHDYDRNAARQDTPVDMIVDVNAEALQTLANKRLCNLAALETRCVVEEMCKLAVAHTPELDGLLVPDCQRHGGRCYEMHPCTKREEEDDDYLMPGVDALTEAALLQMERRGNNGAD